MHHEPLWRENIELPSFPALDGQAFGDVVIVGGGITGILTAYVLTKAKKKVILLEADELMNGTTGHTTAKLTAQHHLFYDQMISAFSEEEAKQYYEANMEAIHWVKETIRQEGIDCDWKEETAYVYTNDEAQREKMMKEAKSYQTLGIDGGLTESMPWKVPFLQALQMNGQAQFHPLKFLKPLVDYIQANGSSIYEHSPAEEVQKGEKPTVTLRSGAKAVGDHLVIASHFPFYDKDFYFAKMHAERSYVIAIKPKKPFPGGMYITAEKPRRSIRSASYKGEEILIIGGNGHKTGKGQPTEDHYTDLEAFAEKEFGIEKKLFSWSAQDLFTLDDVPYIGKSGDEENENIYTATGYKKWGMTSSVIAANLLSDLILNKQNRYSELFTPHRLKGMTSVANFVKKQSDVAAMLVKGKLEHFFQDEEQLPVNKGVVVNWDGTRAGAFKEADGTVHLVDTTCTHMGCECEWNGAERTWDCPCHGSRFSVSGEVVEGPAKKPLKTLGQLGNESWQE
ncbi:FAD-dependent oxidoreductase [Bacillus thermotolerans]|uniref:Rieske [2Fe-2S] iron-sulfur protein n=1 Tax=Bacillus thermotolerans TaxID=1221996 RepID=A0A0F5HVB8_BACTR|nr:FAD-dependent oxidoreductase [Bacillus thermotolerans]KKB37329.1 Rieske [2Fe-2S] iron-sulfur protein [Bacillus thermotolerans]